MRIAMLAPIARRTSPRDSVGVEAAVSSLTEACVARGVDVTLFATKDSETAGLVRGVCPTGLEGDPSADPISWLCRHAFEVFKRSEEFDLIHNHAGIIPLMFSPTSLTPVVTTFYESPPEEAYPLLARYSTRAGYVVANRSVRFPQDVQVIEHESDDSVGKSAVDRYLELYEEATEREDRRPWGHYVVLSDEIDHKVKRIVVEPGKRLSLQRHRHRTEHWYVVQGKAIVTLDDDDIEVSAGETADIARGTWHRVRNPGTVPLVFIEVQTGSYFGEDDIERREDDYGRS